MIKHKLHFNLSQTAFEKLKPLLDGFVMFKIWEQLRIVHVIQVSPCKEVTQLLNKHNIKFN